ncbi:MAG: TlpA family protein disulfide reductase [Methanotrichaceae archaeon]
MDLMDRAKGFMNSKLKSSSVKLAERYGVPVNEVEDTVSEFLANTYGPALNMAESISGKDRPVLLFIWRKGCGICQKSKPELEKFIQAHSDLDLVVVDYSDPEGVLYHIINQEENGMLPMIAMIFRGNIKMIFTGVCVHPEVYEKYYKDLKVECSQNIYAL